MGCCFGVQRSDDRFFCTVYLEEMFTATSGDTLSRHGEFYLKVGHPKRLRPFHYRYPTQGHLKMTIGETFLPTPRFPMIYSQMLDVSEYPYFEFRVRVCEQDVTYDDRLLDAYVKVPVRGNVTGLHVDLDNDPKSVQLGEEPLPGAGKKKPKMKKTKSGKWASQAARSQKNYEARNGEPFEVVFV